MKDKVEEGCVQGISRRQVIGGAAAAVVAGASAGLMLGQVATQNPEPHQDLFQVLTLWLAATNDNAAVNNLKDDTMKSMGLDPSALGALRKHVQTHPVIYGLIQQEFLTFAKVYSYGGGECPKYAGTLSAVAKLTAPKLASQS